MIAMMRPKESWVARWNGISKTDFQSEEKKNYDDDGEMIEKINSQVPGLYAIKVFASEHDGQGLKDNHLDEYESDEGDKAPSNKKLKTKSERYR
jgi:hypothetical protein